MVNTAVSSQCHFIIIYCGSPLVTVSNFSNLQVNNAQWSFKEYQGIENLMSYVASQALQLHFKNNCELNINPK